MGQKTLYFLAILLAIIGCKQEYKKNTGSIFGTTYHITYDAKKDHQKAIDSIFKRVNNTLSTYIPNSDISRVNKNDSTVVINKLFKEAFNKAKKIHKETNGYFDPTLGQLINAYGFGKKKSKHILTTKEIDSLMKLIGFDKVQLVNGKIKKTIPEIQFDVNAFAKGLGIDLVGRFLESKNINNYLVEIGGEIRVRGMNHEKQWKVAVEKPNFNGLQSFQKIIELSNKSMATSGNYRKFRLTKDGRKYVHIVNPKTGLARGSNLLSATVISEGDCADVDAYATAFMAMGLEKTKSIINKQKELKVILLFSNENGEIVEFSNL